MRNEGGEPTPEGPRPDDGSTRTSEAARRPRRPKHQIIAGAAGVLAVLGAGGAIVAAQARDEPVAVSTADPGALPQLGAGATPPPSPVPGASVVTTAAQPAPAATGTATAPAVTAPAATAPAAATTAPARPRDRDREPDGGRVAELPKPDRTLRALPHSGKVKDSDVTVVQHNSPEKKQTFKVASARADLTGYRELSWVAGESQRVGDAECTNTIRLSPDAPARPRPTLLLCWRLSADRSVYTVAVDRDGRPSVEESVAALTKRWNELD